MHSSQKRLASINGLLETHNSHAGPPVLIAVSKTFGADDIEPILKAGHRDFGENRVQETKTKWPALKERFPDTVLHLIGPLQSNKAADAVRLFDVIHTVDRPKIATAIANEMAKQRRNQPIFIQVNTGDEPQKAGISFRDAPGFIKKCRAELALNVIGLMCIPPISDAPGTHFQKLAKLAKELGLAKLSMGMSADYPDALRYGATHIRLGSAIFGARS